MSRLALAALGIALAATAAAEPPPRHDYVLHCAGCHKLDGTGSARVPALIGVDRLLARPGGRAYLLGVPGVAQAPLSDARLAALMNWIAGSFGDGVPQPPFSGAEVAHLRTTPLRDPGRVRASVLAGMDGGGDPAEAAGSLSR